MELIVLIVLAPLVWLAEKRWHLLRSLFLRLNRRVGLSLPVTAVWYVMVILPTLMMFRMRGMQYSHAGAAELGAMIYTAMALIVVLPFCVYDLVQKKWHGALSIPLTLGIYFVWGTLWQMLISSGRVTLEE